MLKTFQSLENTSYKFKQYSNQTYKKGARPFVALKEKAFLLNYPSCQQF